MLLLESNVYEVEGGASVPFLPLQYSGTAKAIIEGRVYFGSQLQRGRVNSGGEGCRQAQAWCLEQQAESP